MKKLNTKLSIPKLKSVYNYQQVKIVRRTGDTTDPTNGTIPTTGAIIGGGW